MSRRTRPLFSLGRRLSLCASMVRDGTSLVDVGTDHAYLPVWLAKQGLIRCAIAVDIRPGPLERARFNIERYGVQDLVSVRLSDGLERILPHEAEDIVIAGMGGLMMIHILQQTPWLKSSNRRLILQPMTKAEELRCYLSKNGFFVEQEMAAAEDGHIYSVMQVSFRPEMRQEDALFCYIGKMTPETDEGKKYLELQKRRLKKRANGLNKAGTGKEANRLFSLASEIERILSTGSV
jgi:tRNA (adenine22-N1)-methyltransferase